MPPTLRQLTLSQFLALPEDTRYEIVDGALRPTVHRDATHRELQLVLTVSLDGQRPPGVSVFHEEVIVLGEQPAHARIADIAVFRTRPGDDGLSNNTPASDVLLVVEIEGPSTRRADRWEKPAEYSEAGIPSYWRIETDPRVVCHTYRLINGAYQPGGRYRLGDVIRDANLDWIGVRLGL